MQSFVQYVKLHKRLILLITIVALIPILLIAITHKTAQEQKQAKERLAAAPTPTPQWKTYDQKVQANEIAPASKIVEVYVRYNPTSSPNFSITGTTKMNGYAKKPIAPNPQYKAQLLDANGNVLTEAAFDVEKEQRAEVIGGGTISSTTDSNAVQDFPVNVNLNDLGTSIRIVDIQGQELVKTDLTNMGNVENKPTFKTINGDELLHPKTDEGKSSFMFFPHFPNPFIAHAANGDGKIDVTIVSYQYTDFTVFQNDVSTMSKSFLDHEPFKSRASQFAFHTVESTSNLNCKTSPGIAGSEILTCDGPTVKSVIDKSGAPTDVYVVLINERACQGQGLRATSSDIIVTTSGRVPGNVLAHEMGHQIGRLDDEYISDQFQTTNGPADNKLHSLDPNSADGNCYAGTPPSSNWSATDVQTNEYTKSCTYPNWYSSSPNSLMRFVDGPTCFNPISQKMLNTRMDAIAGKFSGTITTAYCERQNSKLSVSEAPASTASNINPTYVCAGSATGDVCPNPVGSQSGTTNPGTVQANGCVAGQLYCNGNVITGGQANTLYICEGAGKEPSVSQQCATTCTVSTQGGNDACAQSGSGNGNDQSAGKCDLLSNTGGGYVGQCKPEDAKNGWSYCQGDGPNSLKCLPPGQACNATKNPFDAGAGKGQYCADPTKQAYKPPASGTDRGTCTVCPKGATVNDLQPNGSINTATTCSCPTGQVVVNNACIVPIDNCTAYTATNTCSACSAGYKLQNNSCQKPPPPPPPPAKTGTGTGGGTTTGACPIRGQIRNSKGVCYTPQPSICHSDAECKAKNANWLCKADGSCGAPAVSTKLPNGGHCGTNADCQSGYCNINVAGGKGGMTGQCSQP